MPDRPDATHTPPPRDPAQHLGRQTPTSGHTDPATQALSVLAAHNLDDAIASVRATIAKECAR
jgi:hypothetical protein